jgi:hypothetical protein
MRKHSKYSTDDGALMKRPTWARKPESKKRNPETASEHEAKHERMLT